jgi:hypothetical protein
LRRDIKKSLYDVNWRICDIFLNRWSSNAVKRAHSTHFVEKTRLRWKFEAASAAFASQAMHNACCLSGFLKFFVRGISQMKKIAVSLVLASAMALAACSGAEEATTEEATAGAEEAATDAAAGAEAATDAAAGAEAAATDAAAAAGDAAEAGKDAAAAAGDAAAKAGDAAAAAGEAAKEATK